MCFLLTLATPYGFDMKASSSYQTHDTLCNRKVVAGQIRRRSLQLTHREDPSMMGHHLLTRLLTRHKPASKLEQMFNLKNST